MGLLVLGGPLSVNVGSLLYGIAYILGYIAIMYLVGGAASLNGDLRSFRIFCVVEFVISFVFTPALEYLFAGLGEMGTAYNLIALGVMVTLVCAVMALSPVLNNRVFSSDWVNGLVGVNPAKYGSQLARVEEVEKTEPVELATLTPRERDVLTLLLTDIAPKQIAHELKISTSTFNYHSTNLYRKLGVNSRIELIMRFNR
jgi:DNA-binding CsgD family transcriptional regulator